MTVEPVYVEWGIGQITLTAGYGKDEKPPRYKDRDLLQRFLNVLGNAVMEGRDFESIVHDLERAEAERHKAQMGGGHVRHGCMRKGAA